MSVVLAVDFMNFTANIPSDFILSGPYCNNIHEPSVPVEMAAGTFSLDQWLEVAVVNIWYQVTEQPGTNG